MVGFTGKTFWQHRLLRYSAIALAGLLSILALAACNPSNLRSQAAQGTQVIESQLGDPKTFNYALNNSIPNVFGYLYEGLITENPLTSQIEPALAESWQISPDKKSLTFTLRDGLKWSDGQPLTIDDVVFSFAKIYLNPDIPTDIQDTLRIGTDRQLPTVKKLNNKQVQFTTPQPFAPFLRSMGLGIMPAHILEKTVTQKDKDGKPLFLSTWDIGTNPKEIVTNGPYTLAEFVSTQRVIFQRNPNYWRKDDKTQSQPYIDRVVWNLVDNRDTTLLKFRSGESDTFEPLRPEDFPLLKAEEKRGKFKVYVGGARPGTTFISFNLNQGKKNGKPVVDPIKSKWFNNTAFRQAIAHAIDREKMNRNSYRGLGILLNSTIAANSPYYLSPEKGLKVYDYNLDKAKQILLSGGFKYDPQGKLLDADGNPIEFNIMTNSENTLRLSLIAQIKQDLSKIGMTVNLNPINFNSMLDKLDNTLDWECYLIIMGNGVEPHAGSNIWQPDGASHTFNQRIENGKKQLEGQKVADWEAEVGRLYTQGASELDENKRKEIYGKAQQILQEQLPWIPLVVERIMAVGRDEIQGVKFPESGGLLWNIHELRMIN
jgi:peptide/nickel transport system substrate-binding protein